MTEQNQFDQGGPGTVHRLLGAVAPYRLVQNLPGYRVAGERGAKQGPERGHRQFPGFAHRGESQRPQAVVPVVVFSTRG